MIKFFRKIRHTMINENKVSKYMLYAIGEIILVVIGILIALQINNWNEQRKDNKQEFYILKQLQKEFKADSSQISNYIRLTKIKTKNYAKPLKTSDTQFQKTRLQNMHFLMVGWCCLMAIHQHSMK
mgnify:CR=1 FL=1